MTINSPASGANGLLPYVPALVMGWTPNGDDDRHMRVSGTLLCVDISGFTRLTERLARRGNVGAEEISDLLSSTFAALLTETRDDGADLVKWGGDAMLLLFRGANHAVRATRSAHRMRAALRVVGRLSTSSGNLTLRMSAGVHSDDFDFFLVGDPDIHRELLISGPAASITADMEAAATAGQIGLSLATAALLDPRLLGPPLMGGRLLRSAPARVDAPPSRSGTTGTDPARVLPPPIRAHLLGGATEAEHRLITVAFVQFSGTDDLIVSAGTHALAEALDEVVRIVQRACAENDVTFFETDIGRDGGKVMLTAGAPRSADHDEERMLRVARLVLDRAGTLPLRIGINRGHVFAGDFGPPFRRTYSVKGDAINLAARVMAKADPGQALATVEVVARSQTVFGTEELPPFMVKGKSQPVRAAAVGELVGARNQTRPVVPMIGRADELGVLHRALDDAREGRGRLVEIVGEAGIGKSRLVAELLAGVDGVSVVRAPCQQYESSTPYFPFRRLLRDVLGVPGDADAEEVARRLVDRVSSSASHLVPWLPLLGIPMDVRLPPTRETEELDDQFLKGRLEVVVDEILDRILTVPTVLVIEDAHEMDDASADLLRRLADHIDDRPWLLLVNRREHPAGFVPAVHSTFTSLRPSPLDAGAALELVHAALADQPLNRQTLSTLAVRGGGNPMFLEALVLEAGRSGSLVHLPESVEALVTSQIDRLDPADRLVLRYAAVLGQVVDETALDALLEDHDAQVAAGALQRLAEFLVRERPGRLVFRHALMRDVAYEGLSFKRRRVLHDQVGQGLERAASTPEGQCELLSLHFFHAGRHEQAWRYSVLAGERALAKFALGEAIDFFARAAQSIPHHAVGTVEVAQVFEQLADARFLVGLSEEAADAYALARRHLRGDCVRLAAIIEKEARIDHRRRKYSQAMRRISRGLKGLEGMPGAPAGVARSLLARRYAYSRFSQGRIDEALHWADIAARAAEEAVDKDALAQAYEMLNAIHAGSGREEQLPYGRLALQAYTELGNLPRQGHCLNNLAVQAFTAGRWNQALADYRKATDIFRRIGDTAGEGNAIYNQAELIVCQGRYAEAARLLPDVLRIARAVQDDELVALVLREQARIVAASGDIAGAVSLLNQTRTRFETLAELSEVRGTDLVLAEVLLDAGRPAEAGEVLDLVVEGAGKETLTAGAANVHRLIGRQHLAEGRLEEARLMLLAGLEVAEQGGDRFEQALLLLEIGILSRREGRSDTDATDRALEILDSMGVVRAG
ncbi:MAG: AAA family ATPase [Actinomycetota bacterium]|nr:AAA family ATPase [Actinomycetota bacterium]